LGAGAAAAHPLANYSHNPRTVVDNTRDRVEALYVLDQAEVPTFQERELSAGEVLARKRAEVQRGLRVEVDGRDAALAPAGAARIEFPGGQGGLKVTRVEIPLVARVSDPRRVVLRDETFQGRPGWRAIVAAPGAGTAVRSTAPSGDPTNQLRSYPESSLSSPLDERRASFAVRPGGGTLEAPPSAGGEAQTTSRAPDGLTGVFSDAASGDGVLVLLLLAALGWGALHALSPGHGKAMVAAYLIGTRGTARHAVALGATVTITHTMGVFALGLVTLLLSQYILPEDLFPWLTLVSGLLVVLVGVGVLRSRARAARASHHGHHHHAHDHHHDHHHPTDRVTTKSLVAMGAAAGLIPCPSALVVLLGAIAQHQVALGMLLIVAFSAGLALTLTALGLAVVHGRRALSHVRVPAGAVTALPALSAVVIVGVGLVLTAQAVPQLS
jgi:ABC-type nickel/cobalt efflux system permease component RcnA